LSSPVRQQRNWPAGREVAEGGSDDFQHALILIPPGRSFTSVSSSYRAHYGDPAIGIAFTDWAGVHWCRSAEGTLTEIPVPAAEHYGIDPTYWAMPEDKLPAWVEEAEAQVRRLMSGPEWFRRLRTRGFLLANWFRSVGRAVPPA
jgi:hypothetical protein